MEKDGERKEKKMEMILRAEVIEIWARVNSTISDVSFFEHSVRKEISLSPRTLVLGRLGSFCLAGMMQMWTEYQFVVVFLMEREISWIFLLF